MTTYTHQITVPESIYRRLTRQAKRMKSSVNDVAAQTLTRYLAPPIEDDLPLDIQLELDAMAHLSDEALWQIAESMMNLDKVALYDFMLDRLKSNQLTAEGQNVLDQLRDESELLMLRKAHAYVLLQSRGHTLPSLDELRATHW